MFYLTTHSTHFIYGYIASDIWLRTILIVRKETRCRHIGYSYRLTTRVLLYAPSHRQDNTYYGLSYTSRGALVGTRNSSMGDGAVVKSLIDGLVGTGFKSPYLCRTQNSPIETITGINPRPAGKEGNVLFNDALNTFYLRLYGISLDQLFVN